MIQRTLQQVCSMLSNAELQPSNNASLVIQGVSTDTRTLHKGSLFIPLIGQSMDGHEYVQEAMNRGATAALWQRDHTPLPEGFPLILVDHTLSALQELASSYRKQLGIRVIGITGSNGKTSTKDMLASVMSERYRVHKTQGNFNNHIGLPLTLLQMQEDVEMAVLEMGMSGHGEIELLSHIAKPDVVIITNIGEAHLLQLGSREQIAKAKFEITSGLNEGGAIIYHGDEPLLRELISKEKFANSRIIAFGSKEANHDYYLTGVHVEVDRTLFSVHSSGRLHMLESLQIPFLGRHNATNALAVIAAAEWFEMDEFMIRSGLKKVIPTGMRMEPIQASNGLTILNDAYNASPASMKAAIEFLTELNGFRRKIVVLGDMLELGPESESFHRGIGQLLNPLTIDYVFTFGEQAAYIAEECSNKFAPNTVQAFTSKDEMASAIASVAGSQDVVLVKASRGKRLENVVEKLTQI